MKKYKFYLAGGIEKSPDAGIGDRQKLIELFKEVKHIKLVNPCDFKYNSPKYPTLWAFQKNISNSLRKCLNYHTRIADGDVQAVIKMNGIITLINPYGGPGTASEVTLAKYMNIPVFGLYDKSNWRECHPWILSRIDKFFDSPNKLKKYILRTFKP